MKSSHLLDNVSSFCSKVLALCRSTEADSRQRMAERALRTAPRLEVLEDRCLPSVTTSIPSVTAIEPLVAIPDIVSAFEPKGSPTVLFVGDSISWEYANGTGSSVWNAYMAPLGMGNIGIVGQTTQSLLYQFSLGVLTGISPATVVLDIGANNLLQGNSPTDTAAGVVADVATIHLYLPQAHIIVLGVLPGKESPSDPYRQEGAQTNVLVHQMLTGDPTVTYVDVGGIFLQPDGTISTSMMFDYLHPTTQGYKDLTNALLPIIESTLFPNLLAYYPNPSTQSSNQSLTLPNDTLDLELAGLSLRSLLTPLPLPMIPQVNTPLPITPR